MPRPRKPSGYWCWNLDEMYVKLNGETPASIATDGLRSNSTAMDELGCREKQEIGR